MAKIEEQIESLVKEKIENIGYELFDVLYLKEGKNKILRIVIDNENGITLDDCEKVNNEIKDEIDTNNIINEQYFLEVSSPGVERVLRKDWQLKKFIEEEVEVKLFKKDENNKKSYIGKLKNISEDIIIIENNDKELKLERKNIAQIKTVFHYL